MPQCRICTTEFTVPPEGKFILQKLDLPEPQLCFDHALQRRLSYRNERHLYQRNCELCGKAMLAMYAPESYIHVYCKDCWFSDKWDATSYGRDYDPSRPFFEQWHELMQQMPFYNVFHIGDNINSQYSNFVWNSKDCYLSFSNFESDGSIYNKNVDYSKDCIDCYQVVKSELLYDCVNVRDSYHSAYLTRAQNCTDCYFGRDLQDCQDCFGCVNLKHKRFYWYNEPLLEPEYRRHFTEALRDRASIAEHQRKFSEHAARHPVEFATIRTSENVTGEMITGSTNIRNGYYVHDVENAGDVYRVHLSKDLYRTGYTINSEIVYEILAGPEMKYSVSLMLCPQTSFSYYSLFCYSSSNLFGCVGLRSKRYCILNKQYTKETYEQVTQLIIQHMKASGEWGEFFPERYSPHAYNDSTAAELYPLTEQQAAARGWWWQQQRGGTVGKETIQPEDVPAVISKTTNQMTKEILSCITCRKNYRIQVPELQLLRSLGLPVPLACQDCRFQTRLQRDALPEVFQRRCACTQSHSHHAGEGCNQTFETAYAPDRPEIVYCNSCYQAEVL